MLDILQILELILVLQLLKRLPENNPGLYTIGLFFIIKGIPLTLTGDFVGIAYIMAGIGLILIKKCF